MIALLVITDGRDNYLARCIASANENLRGPITERWMFDDTGDDQYRARLVRRFPRFRHINGGQRQGFGGAIRSAWAQLAEHSTARWVFHLEQDFTFNQPVDLAAMADVLERRSYLVQMALRRQAWSTVESAAGGVVESQPDAYQEAADGQRRWLEHRRFWTTNPSLYRRTLCRIDWPAGGQSEGRFTRQLLADPDLRFGYWGARESGVWVEHIGHQRTGVGY